MRIGFATSDWSKRSVEERTFQIGGAGWIRIAQVADALARRGHDVVVGTLASFEGELLVRTWDGKIHRDLPLVVLQRWMIDGVAEDVRAARANGQVVVNDVDDDFWNLDPRNQAREVVDPRRNPTSNRVLYAENLAVSDLLTVSTPALARVVRDVVGSGPRIEVLRNAVDLSVYVGPPTPIEEKPVVGWAGGVPWRSGDLETLRGILGPFLERHDLQALHVGHVARAPSFAHLTGVDEARVERIPLLPSIEYPSAVARLGLGLVPLSDAPFNLSKSWIKGLEYAAAGVPFVAQDSPEYRALHETYGIGAIARRPRHWVAALERLLDPEVRARAQADGLVAVRPHGIEERIVEWETLYRGLLP